MALALILAVPSAAAAAVAASVGTAAAPAPPLVPNWEPTYDMAQSTERLLEQAQRVKNATPTARVFVYRNMVKALPWYSQVREKMLDPAYSGWFLKFDPAKLHNVSALHVPPCTGAKCSDFYHDQEQTPQATSATECLTGTCDCGEGLPCGEYLFDHRNQSLREWLMQDFILGNESGLGNAAIDGFYFDDSWHTTPPGGGDFKSSCSKSPLGGASEENAYCSEDMGLTAADVADITSNWSATSEAAKQTVLSHDGFTWGASSLFVGTSARSLSGLGHDPRTTCVTDLRSGCAAGSEWSTGALLFELTRKTFKDPFPLPFVDQDVAQFLLVRGPYAWLGHNWMGCLTDADTPFLRPPQLDQDYGEPLEPNCRETAPGVFTRKWSKVTVEMDCNTWNATLTPA